MADEAKQDLYLTTRLLMMCYGLTCPILVLFFYALLSLFPKSDGTVSTRFFRKYLGYFKNLSGFCGALLGITLVVNTFLNLFYLVDITILKNSSKYSTYGELAGSSRPLVMFFSIVGLGSVFYGVLAILSYQLFGNTSINGTIGEILREYRERIRYMCKKRFSL